MTLTDRIEIDPDVMLGKPLIRGTRIPVELILRKLSDGASDADLLDAHPRLTRAAIQAAMRYAADALAHEEGLGEPPPLIVVVTRDVRVRENAQALGYGVE